MKGVTWTRLRPKRRLGRRARGPQIVVVPASRRGQHAQVVNIADDKQQRHGPSTLYRNRRQLAPLAIPAFLLLVALSAEAAVRLGADRAHLAGGAAITGLVAALIGVKVGSGLLQSRWRPRVIGWAVCGWTWLVATVAQGLSVVLVAVLVLITVAITSRWWSVHRPGYPTSAPVDAIDTAPDPDDIVENFKVYAACPAGPFEGCTLTDPDITPTRSAWIMNIRPGRDSLNKMLAKMDVLGTAVHHLPEDIGLEMAEPRRPGERRNPNRLRFTVVTRSPVEGGVPFTGSGWREDGHEAWIEAGTFFDGDGRVRIPVLSANSAWNLAIVAPMGGGKTVLLNYLAASARSSGRALLWYLDGKGGASSPVLHDYCDWAPGGSHPGEIKARGLDVLTALEALAAERFRQMKVEGVDGINPTPDRPLAVAIIDECHVFFDARDKHTVQRWKDLVRLLRAAGVSIWAATQYPTIESFGGDGFLKEAMCGKTIIAGRFRSGQAQNLLRVKFDPINLPNGGGWWFVDSAQGRSAMCRSDYLNSTRTPGQRDSDADRWFQATPGVTLGPTESSAMPACYTNRAELAEQERQVLLGNRQAPSAPAEPPHLTVIDGWQPRWPGPVRAGTTDPSPPAGLSEQQARVWRAVRDGAHRPSEVQDAVRDEQGRPLGQSQAYAILKELRDGGYISRTAKGSYDVRRS